MSTSIHARQSSSSGKSLNACGSDNPSGLNLQSPHHRGSPSIRRRLTYRPTPPRSFSPLIIGEVPQPRPPGRTTSGPTPAGPSVPSSSGKSLNGTRRTSTRRSWPFSPLVIGEVPQHRSTERYEDSTTYESLQSPHHWEVPQQYSSEPQQRRGFRRGLKQRVDCTLPEIPIEAESTCTTSSIYPSQ
jgi:hypothetical protein